MRWVGFDGDVRNAGYIATWIDLLKADKRAFFTACSKASKAVDYLRGLAELLIPGGRQRGSFGPEVTHAEGASPMDRLAAYAGRTPIAA